MVALAGDAEATACDESHERGMRAAAAGVGVADPRQLTFDELNAYLTQDSLKIRFAKLDSLELLACLLKKISRRFIVQPTRFRMRTECATIRHFDCYP